LQGLRQPAPGRGRLLSRRAIGELGTLAASVQQLGTRRSIALRLLAASRSAATAAAQREFWLEFLWIDAEYRAAVRRLAQFCAEHRRGRQGKRRPGEVRPSSRVS
jgi:hypothetical protein